MAVPRRYVSEAIRDQVRLNAFRRALEGGGDAVARRKVADAAAAERSQKEEQVVSQHQKVLKAFRPEKHVAQLLVADLEMESVIFDSIREEYAPDAGDKDVPGSDGNVTPLSDQVGLILDSKPEADLNAVLGKAATPDSLKLLGDGGDLDPQASDALSQKIEADQERELTQPVELLSDEEEAGKEKKSPLARMLAKEKPNEFRRAQTIISRTAGSISYDGPDEKPEHYSTLDFHNAAMDIRNNANPNIQDVNGILMVMENVFDWEQHEARHGKTMSPRAFGVLAKSLRTNLQMACPSLSNEKILSFFEVVTHNDWMGGFENAKAMTEAVVKSCLDAQNGYRDPLDHITRKFSKFICTQVMAGIADWDEHAKYHGEAITPDVIIELPKSLRISVAEVFPLAQADETLAHFQTLAENNWMGDFFNIKAKTEAVVLACLDAHAGDFDRINHMNFKMRSTAYFMESFYPDVSHRAHVPPGKIVQMMEKHEERRSGLPKPTLA